MVWIIINIPYSSTISVTNMKILGDIDKKNPKHYESYTSWKEHYFVDYGVNIADIIYAGVVNGKFVQITIGALYDLGEENLWLANKLRRITCKHIYAGANPRMEIANIIDDQIRIDPPLREQLLKASRVGVPDDSQ